MPSGRERELSRGAQVTWWDRDGAEALRKSVGDSLITTSTKAFHLRIKVPPAAKITLCFGPVLRQRKALPSDSTKLLFSPLFLEISH